MSHGHYKALAIFPLLGILCMSPSDMHQKAYFRSIASESFDSIPFPKFSKIAEKIDEKLIIKDHKVSHEDFNKQVADLELKIKEKGASEENVKGILQAQADINKLLTDKVIDSDKGIEGLDKLSALKSQIEKLSEVKAEPKKEVVIVKDAPKKEEPKKEEPKKEEPKKEVAKKEDKKEDDHEDCGNENHKVLSTSIQTLVKDQSAIMQNMMNMMQMMMYMNSQSQMAMNEMKYNNQYQYSNPNSAGNWNYYADRFPMYQPNIFSQQPQQQAQTGWNLAPSQQFQFPQMQMQPQMQSPMMSTADFSMTPQNMGMGSMGMNISPYSFNLGV